MTLATKEIFNQALELKPVERAELIEQLVRSFDKAGADGVDAAWAEEAESRIDAYDAGKLRADKADEIFNRLQQIQGERNTRTNG